VWDRAERCDHERDDATEPRGVPPGDETARDSDEQHADDQRLRPSRNTAVHRRGETNQPGMGSHGCEKVHATNESRQRNEET
jgi:hypothetical protein